LFAVVGRIVYDRTHTRELNLLQPMNLSRALPFAAVTFTIAAMASMGLPGFSGFVAELQVLLGAWQAFPTLAVVAGAGILVGVAFTLRVLQKAFFAEQEPEPIVASAALNAHPTFGPISMPERLGAILLIGTALVIGLFPGLLLGLIRGSFESPLFTWLPKGGG
jgi:NADH-quinone oxidoreductase subunit M